MTEDLLSDVTFERHGNTFLFTPPPAQSVDHPETDLAASSEWKRQQDESIGRYQDDSYEADGTLGELFGGFIAATLDRDGPVVDIGCGLHPILPHYVKHLALQQFIGIEPLSIIVDRGFICLAGVMAEQIPLKSGVANAAIFATSLDHIEDAPGAIKEVLRVLKPGAPLYFWLGVHDPHILAEAKTFGVVHNHSRGLRKWTRIFLAPYEHLHLWRAMKRRERDLSNGVKLDNAHVRYHQMKTIDDEMAGYGLQIVRRVLVPGSSSAFAEARAIS